MTINTDITPDYAFYRDEYHGRMPALDFEAALADSVAEVASRIWRRADLAPHLDSCKMAVCAVAEAVGNPERRVRSYTAGKVSETFSAAPFSLKAEAAVKRYLSGKGVLKGGQWL
jgi:hypothetical protein